MDIDVFEIIDIAKKAGEEILKVYDSSDFEVSLKDSPDYPEGVSPLTRADLASNKIITQGLEKYGLPIISEESKGIPYPERKGFDLFWLVDPLDGTKEFIKKNGEFTVNIALVKADKPVLGVIFAPVLDTFYFTDDKKAFKKVGDKRPVELKVSEKEDVLRVVASKSHFNKETQDFIKDLEGDSPVQTINAGSSLKFCLVAEGKADIYPRLGPTMEWDTAAAHAIVNAAGKKVFVYGSEKELTYNKESLLNPFFVVK